MGYVKQTVYKYYYGKGLSAQQVETRYKAIKEIILFNYKITEAMRDVAIKEEWHRLNSREKQRLINTTYDDFEEILVRLGLFRPKYYREVKQNVNAKI